MFTALLVNDDPAYSGEVRAALADVGCLDIATAESDRSSCLEGSCAPDLIVIDLCGGDVATVRRFKAMFADVPIVAVCSASMLEGSMRAGATDGITKPIRPLELVARFRGALRLRFEQARRVTRERKMSDAVERLEREKQDLERRACVDSLTGVANRQHTLAMLGAEWRRAVRDRSALGVVMIDFDCFHAYNERYGHPGGDACLQRVTEAMVRCLRRPSDFLGRYGGEEFLAVVPNTDAAGTKTVAERLRASVEMLGIPHDASACSKFVTITAGFAAFKGCNDLSDDRLIAVADAALLRAKAAGRNRIDGDAPLVRPSRVSAQRWQRFAPVFSDPWFANRIPPFLAETRDEVAGICEAARGGEFDSVCVTARGLASNAVDYGFPEIHRIAEDVAQAARAEDSAAVQSSAEELLQYLTHVQVVYRRPPEPMTIPAEATRRTL